VAVAVAVAVAGVGADGALERRIRMQAHEARQLWRRWKRPERARCNSHRPHAVDHQSASSSHTREDNGDPPSHTQSKRTARKGDRVLDG